MLRSVDSEWVGRGLSLESHTSREPTPLPRRKATSEHRMAWCLRSRRGLRFRHVHEGSPGTWEALLSPSISRAAGEVPVPETPRSQDRPSGPAGGTNTGGTGGTAKRRKRSAAGWATGSRSVLIVPLKRGNSAHEDPVEGSETSSHEPVGRKHDGCTEIRVPCQ